MEDLKKMKSIDSMSINDFKEYFELYSIRLNEPKEELNKLKESFMGGFTYNMQIISQTFFELGFNPLQDMKTVEALYEKYIKHPEIKKIIEEQKGKR